ncbi:hypothetical protein NUACC21_15670 [Scytonema sp. NUACC21]
MAQIILENTDPVIIEKLKFRAQKHGRSLLEEVKCILQQATEVEIKANLSKDEIIQRKSALMLQQIERHAHKVGKSGHPQINIPIRSQQELIVTKNRLKELKKGISLKGLSIQQAREEGRKY